MFENAYIPIIGIDKNECDCKMIKLAMYTYIIIALLISTTTVIYICLLLIIFIMYNLLRLPICSHNDRSTASVDHSYNV